MKKNHKRGISLVEVVVGTTIIFIVMVGLISAYNLFLEAALRNTNKVKAAYLLEEGMEAVRSIRDESWDGNIATLSPATFYGIYFDNSKWNSTTSPVVIDGVFFRDFSFEEVYRDSNQDIASSGTLDPNTKFFTINVSWAEGGATTTRTLSAYLSKLF